MGILEMHVLMVLLLAGIVAAAPAMGRRRRWPRASAWFGWVAAGTLVAEVAVQIYAGHQAEQAIHAEASAKAVLLASAVSLGLNAAAVETAVLLAILGVVGVLAVSGGGGE